MTENISAVNEETVPSELVSESKPSFSQPEDLTLAQPARRAGLSFLKTDGPFIVNENGDPVVLRGCNLGNWFLLEMWMLDIKGIQDQNQFVSILKKRFGVETADRLMNLYRENWINERDFEIIRRFGFNTVRIPFHYSLLESDARPMTLRKDAFQWLDRAVQLASNAGMYVILDMHGAPGGQSDDHTTGQANENRLFKDQSCQLRFVWLWHEIAGHFKDQPAIAAYDLLNEPYGVRTDAHHKLLVELISLTIRAIRSQGDRHIIFVPGTRSGFAFYGAPTNRDWTDVGFTEHYYPGLFGEPPTMESHAHFIHRKLPAVYTMQRQFNAPLLVGEFNVVWDAVGGADLMRHYYDVYAGYGWPATMWSYKLIKEAGGNHKDSWSMVVNKDPAPLVNVRTASLEEIESYFRWMGTMTYAINEKLRRALTADSPPSVRLPTPTPVLVTPPAQDNVAPWQCTDIGHALPGGQRKHRDGSFEIYGSGSDIWNARDEFRFMWQKVTADFHLFAQIAAFSNTHVHAKAGLMIRQSLSPDSPHVLLHVFPNGETFVAWRESPGGPTNQRKLKADRFPISLAMQRQTGMLTLYVSAEGGSPTNANVRLSDSLRGPVYVGFAVLSHDNTCLTTAVFKDAQLTVGPGVSAKPRDIRQKKPLAY